MCGSVFLTGLIPELLVWISVFIFMGVFLTICLDLALVHLDVLLTSIVHGLLPWPERV